MVIFSWVAMAKNFEVKESIKKTTKKKTFATTDCNAARFVAYVDAKAAGFSHEGAVGMSYSVYFMCLGLNDATISQ